MSHQVLNVSRNTISSFGVALKSLHFHGTGSVSVSPETGALCVLSAALGPLAPCELLARPGDEHCWNDFCLAFAWLLVVMSKPLAATSVAISKFLPRASLGYERCLWHQRKVKV